MLQREATQPVRVDAYAVPLHGAAFGVLVRLLVVQRASVVADAPGAQREQHDGLPTPQPLLHRLLPHLSNHYSLVDAVVEAILEGAGGVGSPRLVPVLITLIGGWRRVGVGLGIGSLGGV